MILPSLSGKRLSYWNANQWAQSLATGRPLHYVVEPPNPEGAVLIEDMAHDGPRGTSHYLKPTFKERLSENAMRRLHADHLYGGYLEDRSYIWRGSYMEPSRFLHLGMDIIAPAGAKVVIDQYGELIQVYQDPPGEESGWGTRLMFRLTEHPDIHLVYGHLRPSRLHVLGTIFAPGHKIGELGTPEQNGGWSAHLHVQAIHGGVHGFLDHPHQLDGYGELSEFEALARRYPDPTPYIRLN